MTDSPLEAGPGDLPYVHLLIIINGQTFLLRGACQLLPSGGCLHTLPFLAHMAPFEGSYIFCMYCEGLNCSLMDHTYVLALNVVYHSDFWRNTFFIICILHMVINPLPPRIIMTLLSYM